MFASRLKTLRKSHNLTQTDIAMKLEIAKSTVAGYEKGFRKPKIKTVNQLAEIFNTSTDYLLGLTDDPTPKDSSNDLATILKLPDFTYKGVKLEDKDLDVVIRFLEQMVDYKKNIPTNEIENIENNNTEQKNNSDCGENNHIHK